MWNDEVAAHTGPKPGVVTALESSDRYCGWFDACCMVVWLQSVLLMMVMWVSLWSLGYRLQYWRNGRTLLYTIRPEARPVHVLQQTWATSQVHGSAAVWQDHAWHGQFSTQHSDSFHVCSSSSFLPTDTWHIKSCVITIRMLCVDCMASKIMWTIWMCGPYLIYYCTGNV